MKSSSPTLCKSSIRAVFLDRDGVINKEKAYVGKWQDFEFIPGSIEALQILQAAGYALVVVTNQSGLARGYYTEKQYHELTKKMLDVLLRHGINVSGVYHCPHHPSGIIPELSIACSCRKPSPGLLIQAACELNLSLHHSILIGDRPSDIQAARAAGVARAYTVSSDNLESARAPLHSDKHFDNLLACAKYLTLAYHC